METSRNKFPPPSSGKRRNAQQRRTSNSIFHKNFLCLSQKVDEDDDSGPDTEEQMSEDNAIEVSFQRGKTTLLQIFTGSSSCSPVIPSKPIFSFPFPYPAVSSSVLGPVSHVYVLRFSTDHPIRVPIYSEDGGSPQNNKSSRYNRMILDNRLNTPSIHDREENSHNIQSAMLLLERHTPVDELAAVQMEIQKYTWEIQNVKKHRNLLSQGSHSIDGGFLSTATWDIQELLANYHTRRRFTLFHTPFTPSTIQRKYLQRKRGVVCHATFDLEDIRQKFIAATGGGKIHVHKILAQLPHALIRVAASVQDVRQVGLCVGSGKTTSFYLIKDDGSSWYDPQNIPSQLLEKMKKMPQPLVIQYISIGPNGSYYIQLASDVYRVAFGPVTTYDSGDRKRVETSWIIVTKDGRILFRNIPSRLQILLQHRPSHMSSIAEVSLGAAGSYFVRFLDGSVDYLLPTFVADACQAIIKQGSYISSLSLHPDAPNDFIVRHTRFHNRSNEKL